MILISDLITIARHLTGRSEEEIKGPSRKKDLAVLRAGIVRVARDHDPHKHTFPMIGHRLGGRDHSSIINLWQQQDYYATIWPGYMEFVMLLRHHALKQGPNIPTSWRPKEYLQIQFVNTTAIANSKRAEQKRLWAERCKEEAKARREQILQEKLAKSRETTKVLKLFHDGKQCLTKDEAIDAYIAHKDKTHRMAMKRCSERFARALLAA